MLAFGVLGVRKMLIRLGYDIELQLSMDMTVIAVLNVHLSRTKDLKEPDELQISPDQMGRHSVPFPIGISGTRFYA
jgi:hypothetical protein